jgi:hypothetical protein
MQSVFAQPYVRARHSHRRPSAPPTDRDCLGDERHESLSSLPRGIATSILERIDEALALGEQGNALLLERMLPPTLGAEPAVVDRLATLRLIEGDVTTASAALGACPQSTPRLDLLRMVIAVHRGDAALAPHQGVVALVLEALVRHAGGELADSTSALCAIVAGRAAPVATLTAALVELEQLLTPEREDSLSARVLAALRGVATDLGLTLNTASISPDLAVTPSDCAFLHRAA